MLDSKSVRILKGDLCKVVTDNNLAIEKGELIKFLEYNWKIGFIFQLPDGMKVSFKDDNDFQFLPSGNYLQELIDMALLTNDKNWFNELISLENINFFKS